jgi:hypothetical protein
MALPSKIELSEKCLLGTNALAYWAHSKVAKIIKFCANGQQREEILKIENVISV